MAGFDEPQVIVLGPADPPIDVEVVYSPPDALLLVGSAVAGAAPSVGRATTSTEAPPRAGSAEVS